MSNGKGTRIQQQTTASRSNALGHTGMLQPGAPQLSSNTRQRGTDVPSFEYAPTPGCACHHAVHGVMRRCLAKSFMSTRDDHHTRHRKLRYTFNTTITDLHFQTGQLHRQPVPASGCTLTQLATIDCGQWWRIGGFGTIQCSHWPAVKRVGSPGCLAVGALALQAASTAAAVPLHQRLVSYWAASCCIDYLDPGTRPTD